MKGITMHRSWIGLSMWTRFLTESRVWYVSMRSVQCGGKFWPNFWLYSISTRVDQTPFVRVATSPTTLSIKTSMLTSDDEDEAGEVGVEVVVANDWLPRLSLSQANLAAASSASFSVLYSVGYV